MKIYGKERDYYDCAIAYVSDPHCTWVRKFSHSAIEESIIPKDWFAMAYLAENKLQHIYSINQLVTTGYVFFCGKTYPFAKYEVEYNKVVVCYSINSLEAALVKDFGVAKTKKYLEYKSGTMFSQGNTVRKDLTKFLKQTLDCSELHLKTNIPIYILDINSGYRIVKSGGCLKDYSFGKVFDPYTCLQEIEMFISGVLGGTSPKMVETSDVTRLESHGFDKVTSFRKGKKNV